MEVNPNGTIATIASLKALLVAKGYTQTYGVEYSKIFSSIAKITLIHLFISLITSQNQALHQLDVKNTLVHIDLLEEVHMEQPYVTKRECDKLCWLKKLCMDQYNFLRLGLKDLAM